MTIEDQTGLRKDIVNSDGKIQSTMRLEKVGEEVRMGEANMVNSKPSEDNFVVTRSLIR